MKREEWLPGETRDRTVKPRHNEMTNLRGFKGSSYGPAGPVVRIDPATLDHMWMYDGWDPEITCCRCGLTRGTAPLAGGTQAYEPCAGTYNTHLKSKAP